MTYHQVWVITLSSWLLAFVGWAALGLSSPTSETGLAIAVWALAIILGILIAWPVSTIRTSLGYA